MKPLLFCIMLAACGVAVEETEDSLTRARLSAFIHIAALYLAGEGCLDTGLTDGDLCSRKSIIAIQRAMESAKR